MISWWYKDQDPYLWLTDPDSQYYGPESYFNRANAGSAVPREVDSSRGHSVRQVHRQVRRLVLRGPTHGAFHLRTGPLPRYRNVFRIRIDFNPDPALGQRGSGSRSKVLMTKIEKKIYSRKNQHFCKEIAIHLSLSFYCSLDVLYGSWSSLLRAEGFSSGLDV